jgi:type VI protein secretion system component Hcp
MQKWQAKTMSRTITLRAGSRLSKLFLSVVIAGAVLLLRPVTTLAADDTITISGISGSIKGQVTWATKTPTGASSGSAGADSFSAVVTVDAATSAIFKDITAGKRIATIQVDEGCSHFTASNAIVASLNEDTASAGGSPKMTMKVTYEKLTWTATQCASGGASSNKPMVKQQKNPAKP